MIAHRPAWETIADRCKSSVCEVDGFSVTCADEYDSPVFVDMDRAARSRECHLLNRGHRRCDYLFLGRDSRREWVGVIEMKSGGIKPPKAFAQLGAGADFVGELFYPDENIEFRPVLVYRKSLRLADRGWFRNRRITLFGKAEQVRIKRTKAHFPMD